MMNMQWNCGHAGDATIGGTWFGLTALGSLAFPAGSNVGVVAQLPRVGAAVAYCLKTPRFVAETPEMLASVE